jgi:hypothetical protein
VQHPPTTHPHSSMLRQRASGLVDLAVTIERTLVLSLPDHAERAGWSGRRARLCGSMLARNLHQLHRAADDLRVVAHRLRCRADELDLARHLVA